MHRKKKSINNFIYTTRVREYLFYYCDDSKTRNLALIKLASFFSFKFFDAKLLLNIFKPKKRGSRLVSIRLSLYASYKIINAKPRLKLYIFSYRGSGYI